MALRPARRTALAYLSQRRGLIFVICIFISFMQAGLFAGRRDIVDSLRHTQPWPTPETPSSKAPTLEHPIPKLMAEAETSFRRLLSKQSRTLTAAVSEYKRRYKRQPPKGFDLWWKFAKENNVKMLDEYDGLMEDLAPFWELSGEELRRRAMQARFVAYLYPGALLSENKGGITPRNRSRPCTESDRCCYQHSPSCGRIQRQFTGKRPARNDEEISAHRTPPPLCVIPAQVSLIAARYGSSRQR
jgi:hypothetical protein